MSRQHSLKRGAAAYRRGKPAFPSSGKSFLIVTEGEKTEPNYLDALRKRLQLSAVDVEIRHPEGTDPITLTNEAIKLRDDRKKKAKRGFVIDYDEVWVVFDLEKMHGERREQAKEAMRLKEAAGIKFAISDPAFEYWLLLHEKFTTRPFLDCDTVITQLKEYWPAYTKGQNPSAEFLEKLPVAVQGAERCRKHHEACGGDGNPSTQVDLLAQSMNSATRPHFQFKLD